MGSVQLNTQPHSLQLSINPCMIWVPQQRSYYLEEFRTLIVQWLKTFYSQNSLSDDRQFEVDAND